MKAASLVSIAATLTFGAGAARAVTVTYSIDPARSSLTLSGSFSGFDFTPQAPGSMVDAYSGSITGDLVGGSLSFSGGSAIVADEHPLPAFNPAGPGVDNYGVNVLAIGATGAYRDFIWDITGGSVTHGSAPGGIPVFSVLTGKLDYFAPPLNPQNGTLAYAGQNAPDSANGLVSISQTGLTETLTLPVTLFMDLNAAGGPVQTWTGTLVATRIIPEPGAALLAAAAAAVRLRRRR